MDYEKEYKELVGKIDKAYLYAQTDSTRAVLEEIRPELKESEDEKIRKGLIAIITDFESLYMQENYSLSREKTLAYLEKQGEKGTNGNEREFPYFVWSKEDEKIYSRIYDLIHNAAYANYDVDEDGKELGEYAKIAEWFKSIKDRVQPQPKQVWSEEDYNEIETIACHLDNIGNECMAEVLRNIRDKYYHTIPQSTWKPSDMELEVLRLVAEKDGTCLMGLYEQLKKLKEE